MAQFTNVYFKGIQTKTSDLLMEDSELKEAVNVDLSKYGLIQKRAGYVQVGNTLETGNKVRGLFPYYKSDGVSQLIAATDSSDDADLHVQYRTTQNYSTLQTISGEAGTRVEGTNFIDYLFGVGYNSTDSTFLDTWSWDGTTYSVATNLTNAPNGKYIAVVNGYLCVANGVDHSAERATSRVWWADPPTALPPTLTWDNDNNYWDFKPHDGEEIIGIKSNFNRLLVFKNTSFHVFDPVGQTSSNISNSIGCDSHRTIVNIDKFTIFFNRKGVYATTGGEPQLISDPVIKFIDAIDQDTLSDICAGQRDNRYYHIFIGDLTVNGIDYVKCELVYDVIQNSWTVNELQDTLYVYANYIQPAVTTTTSISTSSSSSSTSSSSSSSTISTSSSSVSNTTQSTSSSSSSISTSSSSSSTSSISSSSSSVSTTSISTTSISTTITTTTSTSTSVSTSSVSTSSISTSISSSSSSISASSSSSSSSVSSSTSSISQTTTSGNETLRPTGAGATTNIQSQEPASGAHWDKVDEASQDGDTTHIYHATNSYSTDTYATADSGVSSGTINYVRAYMCVYGADTTHAKTTLRTNSTDYLGVEKVLSTSYLTYYTEYTTNPNTSNAWTWAEIDAMEIGVSLDGDGVNTARCTQVYVIVNYTP